MKTRYSRWAELPARTRLLALLGGLGLLASAGAQAQAPTVTTLVPARNARAASTVSSVAVTFSRNMNSATASNIKVYSARSGGKKAGTYSTSGATITFRPNNIFKPGETVFTSIPGTVQSITGTGMARRQVYQFTTLVSGAGRGNFLGGTSPAVGQNPVNVAMGDVDGDGDLDLATANWNTTGTVSVRLNGGAATATNTGTFSNGSEVSVGNFPFAVVLGDVDGDGDLDMATPNGDNTVSVRLNSGTGTFTGSANVSVGRAPRNLAMGDVDADGDLDLVVNSFDDNTLSVLLNGGDATGSNTGTFTVASTINVGLSPFAMTLGDVDGDGDLDLLASLYDQNAVAVLLNGGDATGSNTGTFSNGSTVGVGVHPYRVLLGDVDADGDLDLVDSNRDGTISIVLNGGDATGSGTGIFSNGSTVAVSSSILSIALGDVDADGDLDIATANPINGSSIQVLLNSGTGTFPDSRAVALGSQAYPYSVALGDVDGDGDLDMLTTSQTESTLNVRLNSPPAPTITSFSPTSGVANNVVTLTGTNLSGATSVSVNGANVTPSNVTATSLTFPVPGTATATQSITVTTPGGPSAANTTFTVLLGVTPSTPGVNARTAAVASSAINMVFPATPQASSLAPTRTTGLKVYSAQVGGRKAGTVIASGSVAYYTSNLTGGRGNFKPGEVVSVSIPASVQSTSGLAARKRVYQFTTAVGGTGQGNFQPGTTLAVGGRPFALATGDVDGDGDLDLAVANHLDNTVSIRLNGGSATALNTGVFSNGATVAVDNNPTGVVLGDVDGDGDLDLVVSSRGNSTVNIVLNGGDATGTNTGTFSNSSTVAVGSRPNFVALGDVDGDGDLDIATANSGDATASILLNGGDATGSNTGAFTVASTVGVGTGPSSVALGDVDGDGDLDLLVANATASSVSIVLNGGDGLSTGTGTFSNGTTVAVGASPNSIALGDVDKDGDLDLVTANSDGNSVSVRLNGGNATAINTGVFSNGSTVAVGARPASVALSDVDADGDLDVVAANYDDGTVSMRVNGGDMTGSSTGVFSNGTEQAVGSQPICVVLGDVDADNDLDVLTANYGENTVSVRLNRVLATTISSLAPATTGLGQAITLTGTSLSNPTAFTINGANALPNIVSSSATSVVVRVPVAAAATGNVSITTANGTATSPLAIMAPPGNALSFDGTVTFISFNSLPTTVNYLGVGNLTMEAWVYYNGNTNGNSIIRKTGDYSLYLNNGKLTADVWPSGASYAGRNITGSATLPANRWTHVACTSNGSSLVLYVNGVADPSATLGTVGAIGSENLTIGRSNVTNQPFAGRLDEVRVYKAVLTAAQVQADMLAATVPLPSNLVFYLNFDQGTPDGNNSSLNTIYDVVSGQPGNLSNFYLTSGRPSNYVESYALVVPTATAATAVSGTGFTANWTAPAQGTVDNGYRLDVSTSATFATAIAGSPFTVASGTSQPLTGLTAGTTYYYRVRADKTSVTGQGVNSNVVSVVACSPLAAVAQDVSVVLDANGRATVTAAQVNNGSTANCGLAPAAALSVAPSTFTCANLGANTVTLTVTDAGGKKATATATVTVSAPVLTTTTWTGASSTDLTDCANWSYGQLPTATIDAVIPANPTNYPSLSTGTLAIDDLLISPGSSLTVARGATLQVGGNLTNNGTATLAGTVAFVGSVATQTLGGSSPMAFTTLVLDKPAGTVQLAQNLTINTALTLASGTLATTASYQVSLGSAATLAESETSYVVGRVVTTRTLAAGTAEPFGGLGLTLTPASGSINPGSTTVVRTTGTALSGGGTGQSIKRYFDIAPAVDAGLNVQMDFAYFMHELNGIPVANLNLYKSVTTTAGPWSLQNGTTPGLNVVTKTGITDFSIWTLGNAAAPLPVGLTAFTAVVQGPAAVRLAWATATESNSARFEVERSQDGILFAKVGAVAGAGTSTGARTYGLTDAALPTGARQLYYRLRQVDLDGTATYSPVRTVALTTATAGLSLYPNPTQAGATLAGAAPGTQVQVFDALGRLVAVARAEADGTAQVPAGLPKGVYVVRSGTQAMRLTIN